MIEAKTETAESPIKKTAHVVLTAGSTSRNTKRSHFFLLDAFRERARMVA